MSSITAAQVKALRDATGAPMMKCKKFLVEANGDMDEAVKAMRKHGMLGRAGDVIPIAPPLCITESEIDEAVSRLRLVITDIANELR